MQCVETPAVACGDLICPPSSTCVSAERGCAPTDQVPATHATIQELIDDEQCAIAHVSGGTYTESIRFERRDARLTAVGEEPVILRGLEETSAVVISAGANARLSGFEISGGGPVKCGGGVRNEGDLFLENMLVRENTAETGGGICHESGSLFLFDTTVDDNVASSTSEALGGGLVARAVVLATGRTRFAGNIVESTSLAVVFTSTTRAPRVQVSHSVFANNGGGPCSVAGTSTRPWSAQTRRRARPRAISVTRWWRATTSCSSARWRQTKARR